MNMGTFSVVRISIATAIIAGCTPNSPPQAEASTLAVETRIPSGQAENVVLRKMQSASGNPADMVGTLEKIIGSWHQSPDNFSEAGKAWMSENNISDFYDSFSWGTNKAWIDFGDYRVIDGVAEKTGVGIISWHTGFKHLRFREAGSEGGFVDGMLEVIDENTFIRHFEFFAPDGEVSYYSDTWTFDPQDTRCFSWQSTGYEDGEPKDTPPRQFCKTDSGE